MVRTKADRVPTKSVGGKAPHKAAKAMPAVRTSSTSKGRNYSGGNPTHPRETPEWQKPITCFLNQSISKDPDSSEIEKMEDADNVKEEQNELDAI